MKGKHIWIWPLAAGLMFMLGLGIIGTHWTWSLYDELSWIEYYIKSPSAFSFIKLDFVSDGRVRPLSQILNFARFSILGINPQVLRIERVLELIVTVGACGYYLISLKRVPWFAAALGLAFWLKSPPLLEQLRWLTVIELPGIFLVVVALILRPKSVLLSYIPLVLAALTKEPMALMLALPSALDRRWKEFTVTFTTFAVYIIFLFLNRHGYSSLSTANPYALKEIAKQAAIDFGPLLLLFVFMFRELKNTRWMHQSWSSAVFLIFGLAYAAMVTRMAWGYTYIFAPSIFLFGMSLATTLGAIHQVQEISKRALNVCMILVVLFSCRIGWNWTKNYLSMSERHKLFQAVAQHTGDALIGTNCHRDRRGIGFAADLLKNKNPLLVRADGPSCADQNTNVTSCCGKDGFVAFSSECTFYSERITEARSLGLNEIYSNDRWVLFKCKD